jgi:hypothetical protein
MSPIASPSLIPCWTIRFGLTNCRSLTWRAWENLSQAGRCMHAWLDSTVSHSTWVRRRVALSTGPKKHGGYCHGCEPGGRRAYVIVILVSKSVAPVILTRDAAWLRYGCGLPKSVVPGAICNPVLCMLKVSRECVLLWLHIPYISVCVYPVRRKEGPAK